MITNSVQTVHTIVFNTNCKVNIFMCNYIFGNWIWNLRIRIFTQAQYIHMVSSFWEIDLKIIDLQDPFEKISTHTHSYISLPDAKLTRERYSMKISFYKALSNMLPLFLHLNWLGENMIPRRSALLVRGVSVVTGCSWFLLNERKLAT